MKKFLSLLTAVMATFLVGLMALTGCTKKPDINTMIPDSQLVLNLDTRSLRDKADFDNIDKLAFVKLLRQELKNENPKASEIINELIENPDASGLDLRESIALFYDENAFKGKVGVVALMKNAKKFEEFIINTHKSANDELNVSHDGDFCFAHGSNSSFAYCWDAQKAYFFPYHSIGEAENDAKQLMWMAEHHNIADNSEYTALMKDKRDVKIYIDLDEFAKSSKNKEQYAEMYENVKICLSLNFEPGAIKVRLNTSGIDPEKAFCTDFDNNITKYLPQEPIAVATMNLKIDQLLVFSQRYSDKNLNLDEEIIDGITVRRLFNCFNGNFAACISDIFETDKGDPFFDFCVVADINNQAILMHILDEIGKEGKLKRYGDSYLFDHGISIMLNDNTMIFSNNNAALANFSTGGAGKLINDAQYPWYAHLNLDLSTYPAALKDTFGHDVVRLFSEFFKDVEMKFSKDWSGEITVNLQNTDQNSLEFTLKFIDDNLTTLSRIF